MKPKYRDQRLAFLAVGLVALIAAVGLGVLGLRDRISYCYAPADLVTKSPVAGKKIRLGGMVEKGSFQRINGLHVRFVVTDFKESVPVTYDRVLPDLFKEGQGVVAEGAMGPDGVFHASRVLAKHDENYMPPEVSKALQGNNPPASEPSS